VTSFSDGALAEMGNGDPTFLLKTVKYPNASTVHLINAMVE